MLEKCINKYFELYVKEDNDYCDTSHIILALEFLLNKSFNEIKETIKNLDVNVTKQEIEEYLANLFSQEQPDVLKRIQDRQNVDKQDFSFEFVKNSSLRYEDELVSKLYQFEPYTLKYYKRYICIVKSKALLLLSIMENINNNDISLVKSLLNDFDIEIVDSKISKTDLMRMIDAFIYNYYLLETKVEAANELKTYYYNKISKESLYKSGINEDGIYPTIELQVKNLNYDDLAGNIKLSERQREELQRNQSKQLKKTAKMIVNLFD